MISWGNQIFGIELVSKLWVRWGLAGSESVRDGGPGLAMKTNHRFSSTMFEDLKDGFRNNI